MIKLNQTQKIIFVFLIKIIIGTLLLYFWGFKDKVHLPTSLFLASLFTAVSSICTGLTVINPGQDLNFLGQIILLFLIQIGGLGFLTLSNWLILSIRGKIYTNAILVTQESLGFLKIIPIKFILQKSIIYTLIIEGIGTLILFLRFVFDYPLPKALWLALFHSISAFCNAGFSLFPTSLMQYQNDLVINFTIMSLIILGGIGFIVLYDLEQWVFNKPSRVKAKFLSLHSKIVLTYTAVLIVIGTVFFLIFEWTNVLSSQSVWNKFLNSLFLAVTARTAGFNTVEIGDLSNASLLMLMFLMFIGASPGSTGGGIKTTTFAVIYTFIRSQLKNHPYPEIFYRTVPYIKINKALGIIILYFIFIVGGVIGLQITELSHLSIPQARTFFIDHLFEVISAQGTVGLSTGITSHLSDGGLCILMICMFVGRLGPLAVVSSMVGAPKKLEYSYPQGDIFIG